jgi:Transposase DDE domain
MIDRSKIRDEQRLDGKYLITSSDDTLSAEDVALGYKNLLEAERGFKDLKGTLLLRPVFHRKQDRIRAHVLICFLALVIVRVAELRTATTWRTIGDQLLTIKQGHSAPPTASSPNAPNSPATNASSSPRSAVGPLCFGMEVPLSVGIGRVDAGTLKRSKGAAGG